MGELLRRIPRGRAGSDGAGARLGNAAVGAKLAGGGEVLRRGEGGLDVRALHYLLAAHRLREDARGGHVVDASVAPPPPLGYPAEKKRPPACA